MITAVDTNVLVDVFAADPVFGERSADALRACATEGRLVACEIVWAEVATVFPEADAAADALATLGIDYHATAAPTALIAGARWRDYRRRGDTRQRLVADFLIGAHAAADADRLLTRDRGFYRTYFKGLEILDPSDS